MNITKSEKASKSIEEMNLQELQGAQRQLEEKIAGADKADPLLPLKALAFNLENIRIQNRLTEIFRGEA